MAPGNKNVTIVGGGLAGLIAAIQLIQQKIPVLVIEKRSYPFHRVCGEYISNETIPFLESLDLFPHEFDPSRITKFQLTSVNGKTTEIPLNMGGFGISRFSFDHFLYEKAKAAGVQFMLNTEAEEVRYDNNFFSVKVNEKTIETDVVMGAFGKRSKMDYALQRDFISKRSPYVGVKHHLRTEHPRDLIALHNFKNGYCGISNVEDEKTNLCYLTHRDNLRMYKNIREMEENVLFTNPFIKSIFKNSDFLFDKPEVINEISFETKSPVDNHILMMGDAAGMIAPLCGNGMAMAIHSAMIGFHWVLQFCSEKISRAKMEDGYSREWSGNFSKRLWAGRQIQKLFGGEWSSNLAVNMARFTKPVAKFLVSKTHGVPF